MKPTVDDLKRWSRKHKPLALAVCTAQAAAEVTRKRVDAYVKPIFESFAFQYCGDLVDKVNASRPGTHVGPLPSPEELYLCDDPRVMDFYKACHEEHIRQGFDSIKNKEVGYCPALIAEHLLIDAQSTLIEAAEPLFGIEAGRLIGEDRKKYLDLLIGSCLCDDKKKEGKIRENLFIGVYPTGLVYADRSTEVAGDYKRLGYLNYRTLKLELEPDCDPAFVPLIQADAKRMQSMRGKPFPLSTCGQSVVLGGGSDK